MSNNIQVKFSVSGNELSSYLDVIQKKSDNLTNAAISGAIQQSNKAKEQLKIINETIAAIERKSKIEGAATRSILSERREAALKENLDTYTAKKNEVFADKKLSEGDAKEKINALSGAENAQNAKINSDYRENLNVLKEQERQEKIQTQLSRESIEVIRQFARENVKAITSGDKLLSQEIKEDLNASKEEWALFDKLTEEGLLNKPKEEKTQPGIFSSLLAVDNINKLIATVGQFTSTQNGFDLIKPAANTAGRIIGGLIGGVLGSIVEPGGGSIAGATIGASLGGAIGQTVGELEEREAISQQNFERAAYRYRGITGQDYSNRELPNMANVGVDVTTFLQQQSEFARRRGYASGSDTTTRDALYAEKGFGVDQGVSAGLIEIQRSSKESNRDLAGLIGAVIQKGQGNIFKNGDNTFLNEFLSKFTSLQKELLKTSETVPTGTTMDILSKFDAIGGAFSARDLRSAGYINSIQGSLSNPSSDNMKALGFRILSEQNPNAGLFDLREKMQGGLNTPGYLKGVLQYIDRIGGDDQSKLNNLSGAFSGLPLNAVRRLFNNRDQLEKGNISVEELQQKYPTDFKGAAEKNTAELDKNQANINNALLQGSFKTIDAMASAFEAAISKSLSGAVIELNDNKGTIKLLSTGAIKQNKTKVAGEKANGQVLKNAVGSIVPGGGAILGLLGY